MALVHGAEIILNVSAWPMVRQDNWRALCHVRAVENQCFLVACNMAGVNHGHQFLGGSTVIDPAGTPVASAGTQESVLKTEIDIQEIYRLRKSMPVLEDSFLSK
jgi:predicted amidohydrolase